MIKIVTIQHDAHGICAEQLPKIVSHFIRRNTMKRHFTRGLMPMLLCLAGLISMLVLSACGGGEKKSFEFEGKTLESGRIGVAYSADLSIHEEDVFYELDYSSTFPRGLSMDDTGKISGTPREAGSFSFTIVAYNDQAEKQASFQLTIEKGTLSYSGKTLDDATAGEAYIQYLGTATGSDSIRYQLKNGSILPEGLSLEEESGKLSGTPAEAADTISFTIVASADGCEDAEAVFTLSVQEGTPALPEDLGKIVFENLTLPDGFVGEEYTESIAKAYGVPGISYAIKYVNGVGLPKGLSFDKELGMITGTPVTSTVGTMRFQVVASADGYDSVVRNVLLRVYDQYVETTRFEAEYIDVSKLTGSGYSSSPQGKNMIQPQRDFGEVEVSNQHALGYLHKSVAFRFEFTSDKAVTAQLDLRLGTELGDIIFDPSLLGIKVNDAVLEYKAFVLDDPDNDAATKDFSTISVGTIDIREGDNVIEFEIFELTEENNPYDEPLPDGTMKAKGPIFDYIELTGTGDARIGWRPVVANLS